MGNIYRDTTLNNVSEQDIGKELKVAGWVENILILGAFGLANMWEAVFADVGVSVIAILNAMRMLRVK